ncbi:uncharacterized protein An03g06160 [Aspergillus niger]|uniref:Contig An03c0190, genomic contig n=2 Tax=Aspergillus niger TaxID=5061 RepID=A2QHA3_ASPNC|nr:uncharacterized protein An03g06160 [Aspergillus niger]CAK38373.1 unnamed protein product [Aspergillus niger]
MAVRSTKPDEGIVEAAWRAGTGREQELTWFFSPRVMAHGKKIDSGQKDWVR